MRKKRALSIVKQALKSTDYESTLTQTVRNRPLKPAATSDELLIWLHGRWIPLSMARHAMAFGEPESGKSLSMHITLSTILKTLDKDSNRRVVVFDTQGDFTSHLVGEGIPHIDFSLSQTGCIWDLVEDHRDSDQILEFCFKLLPKENESGDNVFFQNAARIILYSLWISLIYRRGFDFHFGDLFNAAMADVETQKQILRGHPRGKEIIKSFYNTSAEKTLDNILMQLKTELNRFAPMASYAQREGIKRFSLQDFLKHTGVIVIRQDLASLEVMKPFVKAFFSRYVELVNARDGFSYPPSDFIFADELEFLELVELAALREAAEFSRKKGLVLNLATQSYEGICRNNQSDNADAVLACIPNLAVFRAESPNTAKRLAQAFGAREVLVESENKSFGQNGISYSLNRQPQIRNVLEDGDILNLPFPDEMKGIYGHFRSRIAGVELRKLIPSHEIERLKPSMVHVPYRRIPGLKDTRPWTMAEKRRFIEGSTTRGPHSESPREISRANPLLAAFEKELRKQIFDISADAILKQIWADKSQDS